MRFRWTMVRVVSALAAIVTPIAVHAQTSVASVPIGPQPALTNPTQMLLNPANHKLYVVGDFGTIGVIDALTNTTITHLANTNGARYGMLLSPSANEIYLIGGTIQVIDSTTDTIVRTFTPPPIPGADPLVPPQYASGGYNPVTNTLYVSAPQGLVALDGTTGAELAVVATGSPTVPFVGAQIVNPATNKIYAIASGTSSTVGGYEVYDGATNTRIAGSEFAGQQATDILRGYFQSYHINPADNSVWIASIVQTSVLAADGTILSTPARTDFYRIDGRTDQVTTFTTFGLFTGIGFDPASGRYIGTGGCIPTTGVAPPSLQKDPCSITNTTGFNAENLVAFDPANPASLIAVNTTGFQFTAGFTNGVSCGLGYFQFVGADVSGGNLYRAQEDCTSAHPAELIVGKADFGAAPAPTVPPSLSAHWVANLPTKVTAIFDAEFLTNATHITVDPSTHRALFFTTAENMLTGVDPAVPALSSQLLGNTPAGLAVNAATNTIYVGDRTSKTLNIIDGATNATRPQVQAGAGPYVAVNPATNQVIMAGPSDHTADPNQVQGAFLLDGISESVVRPLEAAATSPVAVNPVTNIAYFANGTQWYAVDLSTGSRTFTGADLSGTGADVCQITGIGVNAATNQIFVAGKCQVNGQTLALFDGATNSLLQQVSLGAFITAGSNFGFGNLGVNTRTNKVYVENIRLLNFGGSVNFEDPAIEVFDGAALAHLATIKGPRGQMAIDTATDVVYACGGYCMAIDGRTDTSLSTFGTPGAQQSAVAVNESTNTVYIASTRPDPHLPGGSPAGFVDVFRGVPPSVSVSGSILSSAGTGIAGITVAIAGPIVTTVTTDATGLFTVPRLTPGTYTITPKSTSFVFQPAVRTLTVADASLTDVTFTAVPSFSISGQIVDAAGAGLPGITVVSQGAVTTTAITDAAGQFALTGFPTGIYTIVPATTAFLYTPASQSVTVVDANVTGVSFTAAPTFTVSGQVTGANGVGLAGVTVTAQGAISATTVTGVNGQFALAGLPGGTYTITPTSAGVVLAPSSQTVKVAKADIPGLTFSVIPPLAITSYTLSPYSTIGSGVVTIGTIVLNQQAPAGGVVVALSASDTKPAKFPATVTVAPGQTSATFNVQGNGVSAISTVTLSASYTGALSPSGTVASAVLTVAPTDVLHVTKATWSTSAQVLTVTATSTNAQAIIAVLNANGNVPLGTMSSLGNGSFSFQTTMASLSSVSIKSNLGGSTGQGVSVIP